MLTDVSLSSVNLSSAALSSAALAFTGTLRSEGNVYFVDILDEEVIRVLNEHGMSRSPLGLTTEETGEITSFHDWFVDNQVVRFVNLSQFPNIQDADLRGTYASVEFGTALEDDGISSLMLDDEDPDEIVPQSEINEYLNNLK